MRNKLLIAIGFVAFAAWLVSYYMRPTAIVEPVTIGGAINAVPGSVTAYAEYQTDLKSEIAGRMVKSVLTLGLVVQKGDYLASLDSGDLQLEIRQLESDYEAHKRRVAIGSSLKLELESSQEDLANKKSQMKFGSVSEVEITRLERLVKQNEQRVALEQVENDQKSATFSNRLDVLRRQLQKMTFTASFDGVVSAIYARPGDLIGSNTPIATIISTSRNVEAKVSEENFAGIKVGQKASVRFLGYGAQLYGASVAKILPTADPETQRYIVYLNVDLPPDKLVPGITGEVNIVIDERENRLIVPRRALRGDELLVVKDNRVESRKVKVGYVSLNQAEIVSGVKEGEQVIVEELDRFRAGDTVRPAVAK